MRVQTNNDVLKYWAFGLLVRLKSLCQSIWLLDRLILLLASFDLIPTYPGEGTVPITRGVKHTTEGGDVSPRSHLVVTPAIDSQ